MANRDKDFDAQAAVDGATAPVDPPEVDAGPQFDWVATVQDAVTIGWVTLETGQELMALMAVGGDAAICFDPKVTQGLIDALTLVASEKRHIKLDRKVDIAKLRVASSDQYFVEF